MKKKNKNKTMLEWAKYYVHKLGLSVFPINAESNEPAIPWEKYTKEYPTDDELEEWFGEGSKYNIGIVNGYLSSIVIFDLDKAKAVEHAESEDLRGVAIVRIDETVSRYHYYHPDSGGIYLKQYGYVVAPPSIHPSGGEYIWIKEFDE